MFIYIYQPPWINTKNQFNITDDSENLWVLIIITYFYLFQEEDSAYNIYRCFHELVEKLSF